MREKCQDLNHRDREVWFILCVGQSFSYYRRAQPHDVEDEHQYDVEHELEEYIAAERVCNKKFDLLKFWKVRPFISLRRRPDTHPSNRLHRKHTHTSIWSPSISYLPRSSMSRANRYSRPANTRRLSSMVEYLSSNLRHSNESSILMGRLVCKMSFGRI